MSFQKNAGGVRRFAKLMRFATWLQNLPHKMTPAPFRLIQISSAFWQSRALYVATRLDIAGALGDESMDVEMLAAKVSADPDAVWRLVRLMAAIGIFEEVAPRKFRNNTLSAHLRSDHPNSVRAMILMHNSEPMSRPWFEHLEQGIRTGQPPFRLAAGVDLFDWMDGQPEFVALFSQAMASVEALTGDHFATDFDWSQFTRIIDLGGARGDKSLAILRRHPGMTALVIDRPPVIEEARQYWASHQATGVERLQFEPGDVLGAVPKAAGPQDVYLMSALLHGFDDAASVQALTNVAQAAKGTGARIAVLELVLPDRADVVGAGMDMQMFMACRGRERTLGEWRALVTASGLALEEVVGLQTFGNILVLRAASS